MPFRVVTGTRGASYPERPRRDPPGGPMPRADTRIAVLVFGRAPGRERRRLRLGRRADVRVRTSLLHDTLASVSAGRDDAGLFFAADGIDEMREIVRGFAEARQIDTLEKLEQFYEPTSRQIDRIQRATVGAAFAAGWARVFVADKFGEATTHWRKLIDRVDRGVGNPCPLLLIGIPSSIVRP